MITYIYKYLKLDNASLLLYILPYIAFNWGDLYLSYFFSVSNLCILFLLIIIFDLFLKIIFLDTRSKNKLILYLVLLSFILIFFYGYYLSTFIQNLFLFYFEFVVRRRFIIVLLIFVFIVLQYFIHKKNLFFGLNVFLIIFSVINFSFDSLKNKQVDFNLNTLSNSFQKITLSENSEKPVILIIVDEYSSPTEFSATGFDSSYSKFSNALVDKNWIVNDSSYSYETSTIHSLGSVFNFNLSKNDNYSKTNIFHIGSEKLLKSPLYDSLVFKDVNLMNLGIFQIGSSYPLTNLYNYPKNFFEQFLFNTIFFHSKINTNEFDVNLDQRKFFPIENHNQIIFDSLSFNLKENYSKKMFVYVHLYMPHAPFSYENEFKSNSKINLFEYYRFWKFTNKKLLVLLDKLVEEDNYRIILSGDHGYRGDSRVNPNNTFTAFYGFSKEDLNSVKSVQDLGSLINACY